MFMQFVQYILIGAFSETGDKQFRIAHGDGVCVCVIACE